MSLPTTLTAEEGAALRSKLDTLTTGDGCIWGVLVKDENDVDHYVGIIDNNATYQYRAYVDRIEIWKSGVQTWIHSGDTSALQTAIAAKLAAALSAELSSLLT